jgi:hypothetical protein
MINPGETYGFWRIIGQEDADGKHPKILCLCACGTERLVQTAHLRAGRSTNCGCRRRMTLQERTGNPSQKETPGFNSWRAMRERCANPKNISYPWYGAKGVRVCERWRHSFERFIADMGPPPPDRKWIERLDNGLGYEPGNCVWASPAEQARNTSRNRHIGGLVVVDAAHAAGVPPPTVYNRLRRGVPPSEALSRAKRSAWHD